MWLTIGLSIVAFILLCLMIAANNFEKRLNAEMLKEQNSK